MAGSIKNWVMIALTFVFVGLYVAAVVGWLHPVSDISLIARIEPIIFVIIGYYFGRLPAQANEQTLKDEIDRQTRKRDAAQQSKESAERERDVMEEKNKNARQALEMASIKQPRAAKISVAGEPQALDLSTVVSAAIQILDS